MCLISTQSTTIVIYALGLWIPLFDCVTIEWVFEGKLTLVIKGVRRGLEEWEDWHTFILVQVVDTMGNELGIEFDTFGEVELGSHWESTKEELVIGLEGKLEGKDIRC